MNINNHRNVASRSKWKENNLLYGKLKKEENGKELIEEAFIIPSKQEYPHHIIRGNTLVLSVDGVKRVYNQLKEKGLYHGKAKQHIDRHLKELGIKMNTSRKMEENFAYIENVLSSDSDTYINLIPDILYFSSPKQLTTIVGPAFLSPLIGISSIFVIDRNQIMMEYFKKFKPDAERFSYNVSYDEWTLPIEQLQYPLSSIHVHHNIPECTIIESGISKGFIYMIDGSNIKNQIKLFDRNPDPSREMIYHGNEPLNVLEIISHSLSWEISYATSNEEKHGKGIIESVIFEAKEDIILEDSPSSKNNSKQNSDKNGVKRKNLYIAFIEYCKKLNPKNTFSSLFDKDIFKERYSFIPHEMRYFYRLANPMSCIIPVIQFESVSFFEDAGIQQALDQIKKNNKSESEDSEDVDNDLSEENDVEETIEDDSVENEMMIFFSINDLPKINEKNNTDEYVIFAGSPKEYYVFRNKDKKIYKSNDDKITEPIADSFDLFIQKIVGKEYL